MRKLIFSLLLALASHAGYAQNYNSDFRRAMQAQDTAKARKVLTSWQQKKPQDPDWYVARFNYLLKQAYRVVVSSDPSKQGGMVFNKANGEAAGSIGEGYEPTLLAAARTTLREGIELAPDRLDMRFGLAKTYEMTGEAAAEIDVLAAALADRQTSGKPWRWRDGAALPAAEANFLPESMEEYMLPYWQMQSAEADEVVRQMAELLVKYYPASSLGPFNLATYYAQKKQWGKALELFQQANARKPNDWQTLANLTKVEIELGHKEQAQQYLTALRKLPEGRPAATDLSKEIQQLK
ncbi:hypothetical protein LGH70_18820 [Hymenobacter sp. BT635]|uniref:Tetratricopeptide repeat protein n=1 Tax=Hymenobacter nitidus TaxID=2880929 RepID=A0ABS8AIH2_9BACT|nr:tetratricopeptide repeat protein [Hymenobacter nitidus]MCB2379656.1 hypothetical protein [Hymenobacter nitidus]